MQALADQIYTELSGTADPAIEHLQVESSLVFAPTPPAIDVYPADPFQEGLAFGKGIRDMNFTVRARVSSAESEGGQDLLLSMMDPTSSASVGKAIAKDKTLGSKVSSLSVSGPSGFAVYTDTGGGGSLLGCTWTTRVIP